MKSCSITEFQTKPSIFKESDLVAVIDKRANKKLGYFISSKYEKLIHKTIKKIEEEEKLAKLKKLKEHQDLEFLELGVDDGL